MDPILKLLHFFFQNATLFSPIIILCYTQRLQQLLKLSFVFWWTVYLFCWFSWLEVQGYGLFLMARLLHHQWLWAVAWCCEHQLSFVMSHKKGTLSQIDFMCPAPSSHSLFTFWIEFLQCPNTIPSLSLLTLIDLKFLLHTWSPDWERQSSRSRWLCKQMLAHLPGWLQVYTNSKWNDLTLR